MQQKPLPHTRSFPSPSQSARRVLKHSNSHPSQVIDILFADLLVGRFVLPTSNRDSFNTANRSKGSAEFDFSLLRINDNRLRAWQPWCIFYLPTGYFPHFGSPGWQPVCVAGKRKLKICCLEFCAMRLCRWYFWASRRSRWWKHNNCGDEIRHGNCHQIVVFYLLNFNGFSQKPRRRGRTSRFRGL